MSLTRRAIFCTAVLAITGSAASPALAQSRKPIEQIGLRTPCGELFRQELEHAKTIKLRHPYVATEWWFHFLREYGSRVEEGVEIPPSEGPYEDKRPISFYLMPQEFADQLAWAGAGLSIQSLRYLGEQKRIEAVATLAYQAAATISFEASVAEFRQVLLLFKALRLRMLFSCHVRHVKGVMEEGVGWLELEVVGPKAIEVRDLLTPLFSRDRDIQVAPFNPRSVLKRPKLESTVDAHGAGGKEDELLETLEKESEAAGAAKDPAYGVGVPKTPVRMMLEMDACKHLPYSEGLQPFRRGWILKDAFPRLSSTYDKYEYARPLPEVIAICEHPGVPSSMTLTLREPIPPGLYNLSLMTTPYRCRKLNNILRVRLGDDEVETAWLLGRPPWRTVPGLRTTIPAKALTITAVQAGSGSRHEAPPYYRWWVAVGRVYLTNVLDEPPGGPRPEPGPEETQ